MTQDGVSGERKPGSVVMTTITLWGYLRTQQIALGCKLQKNEVKDALRIWSQGGLIFQVKNTFLCCLPIMSFSVNFGSWSYSWHYLAKLRQMGTAGAEIETPPPPQWWEPRAIKGSLFLNWSRNIALHNMLCVLPGPLTCSFLPFRFILLVFNSIYMIASIGGLRCL